LVPLTQTVTQQKRRNAPETIKKHVNILALPTILFDEPNWTMEMSKPELPKWNLRGEWQNALGWTWKEKEK